MSDHTRAAPQAPQPTIATAPTPTAEASHTNFSRPATAHSTAPNATPTTHETTGAAPTQTTLPDTPATAEPHTLNTKLNAADRYWKFKGAFQLTAILTSLIGLGTIGWLISTAPTNGFTYDYDGTWTLWPSLLTFTISIIWCLSCILVLVLRKQPIHPGLRVAMDLLLWLGFLATALFAMVSLVELLAWGADGNLETGYYTSSGDYVMASNGSWVWQRDSSGYYADRARDCERNATTSRASGYGWGNSFQNCAAQDAYVNMLWTDKPHRERVEMTGVVCQFFGLVLHFVLFVWACVDCHRHNRSKVSKDAEKLAASIVQTMITNGAVIRPPGQAHVRPAAPWGGQMGYYPLPQQGQVYPMMAMYSQPTSQGQQVPQQYYASQGMTDVRTAGPSSEKSEGPRYA